MIIKGVVLTNAIMQAELDEALFNEGLDYLAQFDLGAIEFYTNDELAPRYGQAVMDRGFEPVFIAALDQKRNSDCRVCSEDENQRVRSVGIAKSAVAKAISSGAKRAIIHGGSYPQDAVNEVRCMRAVEKSLQELSAFAGGDIKLLLEPCDRSVELFHLFGPSMQVYSLMKRLSLANLGLTMDSAHITELFEDPYDSFRLCKPYCGHIHIANCTMDPTSDQFGDKHPLFGVEKSSFTSEEGRLIYEDACQLYKDDTLYISLEMIGRDTPPMDYLASLVANAGWFFTT